jgi:hypothetical protein
MQDVEAIDQDCQSMLGPHAFAHLILSTAESFSSSDEVVCKIDRTRLETHTCLVMMGPERERIDAIFNIGLHRQRLDLRILDLHLDDLYHKIEEEEEMPSGPAPPGPPPSFPDLFSRILSGLQSVFEAVQPRKLLVVDDDTIPSAAASLCAALLHIQVERITELGQGGEADSGRGESVRGDHPEAAAEGRQGGGVLAKYLLDAVSQFQNQVL